MQSSALFFGYISYFRNYFDKPQKIKNYFGLGIYGPKIKENETMQNIPSAIPLSSLEKGETASIIGFAEKGQNIFDRLFELGFVNGSMITANGKAPLGDPLIFTIHGGKLALRKEDAKYVLVKKI